MGGVINQQPSSSHFALQVLKVHRLHILAHHKKSLAFSWRSERAFSYLVFLLQYCRRQEVQPYPNPKGQLYKGA